MINLTQNSCDACKNISSGKKSIYHDDDLLLSCLLGVTIGLNLAIIVMSIF